MFRAGRGLMDDSELANDVLCNMTEILQIFKS